MALGGDPSELRLAARRVREQAGDVSDAAAGLRRAAAAEWKSSAGDVFRRRLDDLGGQHDRLVEEVEDAATALDHLAETLESRQRRLGELLDLAGKTWDDARQMVADGVDDLMGSVENLADAAVDKLKDAGSAVVGIFT